MTDKPIPFRKDNRHPVDEMGEIKEQLDALEARYQELRRWVIEHPNDRTGAAYTAIVKLAGPTSRFDAKAAIRYFGTRTLEPFIRKIDQVPNVKIRPKSSSSR